MSVRNMITVESLDLEGLLWYACMLHYQEIQVKFVYGSYGQGQGHRRKKRACMSPGGLNITDLALKES